MNYIFNRSLVSGFKKHKNINKYQYKPGIYLLGRL